jgi:hypothetical protein
LIGRRHLALSAYNLGIVALREGQSAGALAYLGAAERIRARSLRAAVASTAAIVYGLRGELEPAEAWLAVARERRPPLDETATVFPQVILRVRQGRMAEAVDLIAACWATVERTVTGHELRVLRLVSAFAIDSVGLAEGAEAIGQMFAGARPFRPGEYDYLVRSWPELGRFLAAAGFLGVPLQGERAVIE